MRDLIKAIVADDTTMSIKNHTGQLVTKEEFTHRPWNRDPSTKGGKLPVGVTVDMYYAPASRTEFTKNDVVDKDAGLKSARQRLAVRKEGNEISFYQISHKDKPKWLRDNAYDIITPITLNIRSLSRHNSISSSNLSTDSDVFTIGSSQSSISDISDTGNSASGSSSPKRRSSTTHERTRNLLDERSERTRNERGR